MLDNPRVPRYTVVAVADSGGAVRSSAAAGLDAAALLAHKRGGRSVVEFAADGVVRAAGARGCVEVATEAEYDVLLEASPSNPNSLVPSGAPYICASAHFELLPTVARGCVVVMRSRAR